jgi:hypothetical protein
VEIFLILSLFVLLLVICRHYDKELNRVDDLIDNFTRLTDNNAITLDSDIKELENTQQALLTYLGLFSYFHDINNRNVVVIEKFLQDKPKATKKRVKK